VLTLWRRHRSKCSHIGDRYFRKCRCAVWCEGTVEGKYIRHSLQTRSWERGEELKRQLEDGKQPEQKGITIKDALDAFIRDCEARNLNASTLRKYRRLQRRIIDFGQDHGLSRCTDFTAPALQDFRGTWNLAARTAGKELERLRAVFRFFTQNGWIAQSPASMLKAPQVKTNPRIPFSEKEIQKILGKAKDDRELAFLLTLRHTGLRIGDASLLRTAALADNRLYLHTTKSGAPVSILLPAQLVSLLKKLPPKGGYFFLRAESTSMHTTADLWRRRIKILCKAADVFPDHPHRFRHSLAADLLSRGVSVENVAAILGNSPAIVSRHYSQWISSRQEALDAALESTWKPALALVKK
jgi:integrase/recombinase XerD